MEPNVPKLVEGEDTAAHRRKVQGEDNGRESGRGIVHHTENDVVDSSASTKNIREEGDAEDVHLVDNGTVDMYGKRANKRTTGGPLRAPLTFGAELCERMSIFGIMFNLGPYLVSNLHLSQSYSANVITNYAGTAFLMTLVGGFLADTWLGRFRTIAIFAAIHALGMTILTLFTSLPVFRVPSCDSLSECVPIHGGSLGTLYIAIYLIALGTGGIKSSTAGFGSDQFDITDRKEKKWMNHIFNWFFVFISIGALVGVTFLIYIQEKLGRAWGCGVVACSMLFALAVLVSGQKWYRYAPPQGSPFIKVIRVLSAAIKKRSLTLPTDASTMLYENYESSGEKIEHTDRLLFLSKAAIIPYGDGHRSHDSFGLPMQSLKTEGEKWDSVTNMSTPADTGLIRSPNTVSEKLAREGEVSKVETDKNTVPITALPSDTVDEKKAIETSDIYGTELDEKKMYGGTWTMVTVTEVEELKIIIRLLPVFFTTILFWTTYAQMTTFSVAQAVLMNRWVGKSGQSFRMAPGMVNVLLQLSIIGSVSAYDQCFVPVLRRFTRRPQGITNLQRIGVGLVLAILAMVSASFVEKKRRHESLLGNEISVFWLLPQFALVGAGEAFIYIGQLEIFFRESPLSMRSIATAMFLCTISFGFFTSSFLVTTVQKYTEKSDHPGWLANNLNMGNLDKFYLMLAILSATNFIFFQIVAYWYKYRDNLNHKVPLETPSEDIIASV